MRKVLLVEDDIFIAQLYLNALEEDGDICVLLASDGQAGLDIAKSELPDLILLDIILPKLDGFAVLEQLRLEDKTRNMPVIILSNQSKEEEIQRARKLGVKDFFIKAHNTPGEIVMKVKSYLPN